MGRSRVLIVHPPVSVARDFIDYPYFANLGAVQLAAILRERHDVRLVDAYALPGSGLAWRADGRALLGAAVDEVLESCDADHGRIVPLCSVANALDEFPQHRVIHLGGQCQGGEAGSGGCAHRRQIADRRHDRSKPSSKLASSSRVVSPNDAALARVSSSTLRVLIG